MIDVLQILMAALGSLGFSLLYHVRGWKLALSSFGGGLSWALYLLLGDIIPSEFTRYFVCAVFVAAYAEVLARKLKTPTTTTTTFLIAAIIPHIPGGALYYTMRYALLKEWSPCFQQAFYTIKLALGLALGLAAVLAVLNAAKAIGQRTITKKENIG